MQSLNAKIRLVDILMETLPKEDQQRMIKEAAIEHVTKLKDLAATNPKGGQIMLHNMYQSIRALLTGEEDASAMAGSVANTVLVEYFRHGGDWDKILACLNDSGTRHLP